MIKIVVDHVDNIDNLDPFEFTRQLRLIESKIRQGLVQDSYPSPWELLTKKEEEEKKKWQ